ncbi:stage 0 sporulation protein [Candidatus Gracilibacteria bacterium]|nr:stage 0 sporulation protein [Candidatus Gracilibacteria bacterium]
MNIGIRNLYDDTILISAKENELELTLGDKVIFEQKDRGKEIGKVIFLNRKKLAADEIILDGKILRKTNTEDLEKFEEGAELASDALEKARAKIMELALPMQIVEARLAFDREEISFFFTADERIDFKEVVPKLAGIMKKRIHLTQLGTRDRAKAHGGFGICGREQCCSSGVIPKFRSITMEMVKTQELAMKGAEKLSGPCGKLLCCLAYELEEYRKMRKNLPAWGSTVKTKKGGGKVIALDILNQKVKIWLTKGGAETFSAKDVEAVESEK